MSGRRPDRTRALNFRSTFRECRASAAPGCGPGEDWVTMPQFFVRNPLPRGTPALTFADPPPARFCAEEPGVLDLERGQDLPRRDGRPALLDLPLQPDRGEQSFPPAFARWLSLDGLVLSFAMLSDLNKTL